MATQIKIQENNIQQNSIQQTLIQTITQTIPEAITLTIPQTITQTMPQTIPQSNPINLNLSPRTPPSIITITQPNSSIPNPNLTPLILPTTTEPTFQHSYFSDIDLSTIDLNLDFPRSIYRRLIDRINDRIKKKSLFCSFEFFPPRTASGAVNLVKIMSHLATANPLFCDITWKTAGDNYSENVNSTMSIADTMLNYCGLDTMMHMTCVGLSKQAVFDILDRAKTRGLKNILALKGDLPPSCDTWSPVYDGFNHASDLVSFIRQHYGDYFVICVAGYPTGHPDAPSYENDLLFLKKKVEAGADFVITQLFFKSSTFLNFVRDCREIGITCPILPGILPIQAYQSLCNIARLSKLEVPSEVWSALEAVKDNDEAVRNFGIDYCIDMCRELLTSGHVNGLHFYTLNREFATVKILKTLGFWLENPKKSLPWRPSAHHNRCMESVRPIFWRSRPESYIYRTSNWEEFPNGRWGNSASASFRDLNDYYLFYVKCKYDKTQLLKMWGEVLAGVEDVWSVFAAYLTGKRNKNGVKVSCIPWNDNPLSLETTTILDQLVSLNSKGILTINSQPSVNGECSSHPIYGWGNQGGYVYQKAYLEFFMNGSLEEKLLEVLLKYPTVNYHIVDHKTHNLATQDQSSALTWGVFPNQEIVQPTIYDPVSFSFWKDEAFSLWTSQWGSLYPEDTPSHHTITTIHNTHLLVNLIDNEYTKPSCLFQIMEQVLRN